MFEWIEFWHWWALGVVLILLEIMAPGFIIMWVGIAAVAVGVVLLVLPDMGWQYQLLLFGIFSVVSIYLSWKYLRKHKVETDRPNLNRRGKQLVGRVVTLDAAIVNGQGKVRIADSTWKVEGEDYMKGTKVKVVDVDGTVLKVEQTD